MPSAEQVKEVQASLSQFPYFDLWEPSVVAECCRLSKIVDVPPDTLIVGDGVGNRHMAYFTLDGTCKLIHHLMLNVSSAPGGRTRYSMDEPKEFQGSTSDIAVAGYTSMLFNQRLNFREQAEVRVNIKEAENKQDTTKTVDDEDQTKREDEELIEESCREEIIEVDEAQEPLKQVPPMTELIIPQVVVEEEIEEPVKDPEAEEERNEPETEKQEEEVGSTASSTVDEVSGDDEETPKKVKKVEIDVQEEEDEEEEEGVVEIPVIREYAEDHHERLLLAVNTEAFRRRDSCRKALPVFRKPNTRSFFVQVGLIFKGNVFGVERMYFKGSLMGVWLGSNHGIHDKVTEPFNT